MSKKSGHMTVERLNDVKVKLTTPSNFELNLFATKEVPIDRASLHEAIALGDIRDTIEQLNLINFFGDSKASIDRCILTPDFHRASGIPVGTVMQTSNLVFPKSAGNDIGCGMRLIKTSLTLSDVEGNLDKLQSFLRRQFFEGGRDIAFDETGRANMLRYGISGLKRKSNSTGVWNKIDNEFLDNELLTNHQNGCWETKDTWQFDDYIRGSGGTSRDASIGSVGGGNHFCELQIVDELIDRKIAYQLDLKKDDVVVMVHSGSLGLGSAVADAFLQKAAEIYPKNMLVPKHGFLPLPLTGNLGIYGQAYLSAMGLAANFAVVNRLMMAIMTTIALEQCLGKSVSCKTIWDAPHNLVWQNKDAVIHRKGSTPALLNEPVLIPGSMGDYSYLLYGSGNDECLESAPHGAGRLLSRNAARAEKDSLDDLKIVTPLDPTKVRGEVAKRHKQELMEEAPRAYKDIGPIIDTVKRANMASSVARLKPLITVKG